MNKGLEAFEILKQDIGACYEEEMLIVEKELKRLEKIDNEPYIPLHINRYLELSKKEDVLEILKAFGFEIEDYTENEHGSIKVKCNRIIVDDEEIDIAKEALL